MIFMHNASGYLCRDNFIYNNNLFKYSGSAWNMLIIWIYKAKLRILPVDSISESEVRND